jgi:hypothetical protein
MQSRNGFEILRMCQKKGCVLVKRVKSHRGIEGSNAWSHVSDRFAPWLQTRW